MIERPELTYEAFVTLAQHQGFEMDSPHLKGLFTEVQAMFRRIKLLDQVEIGDIQPGHNTILTDAITPE